MCEPHYVRPRVRRMAETAGALSGTVGTLETRSTADFGRRKPDLRGPFAGESVTARAEATGGKVKRLLRVQQLLTVSLIVGRSSDNVGR